MIYVKLLV